MACGQMAKSLLGWYLLSLDTGVDVQSSLLMQKAMNAVQQCNFVKLKKVCRRSCRRYLLLMLIGLGCAVGCAVVPSYFSAAARERKNGLTLTLTLKPFSRGALLD